MFNQLLKEIYQTMVVESVESSDKEYYKAVEQHYSKELVNMIKSQDKMASMMFGSIQTYKTNDGSLIVRYVDSEDALVVLGIVSVPGVKKTDYMKDLIGWIDEVINKLKEGKTLLTSPNKLSEPLLKQIIKKAQRKGMDLEVNKSGPTLDDPKTGQVWTSYIISSKNS